jgi:hypothetical protein
MKRWHRELAGVGFDLRRFYARNRILRLWVGSLAVFIWLRAGDISGGVASRRASLNWNLRWNAQWSHPGAGGKLVPQPRYILWLRLGALLMPEYDRRTHRHWNWSKGIRELIDMRPFGFFLEGAAV